MGVLIAGSLGVLHPCSAAFSRWGRAVVPDLQQFVQPFVQHGAVELTSEPQRPRQRLSAYREREAAGIGMQVRPSARQSATDVDDSVTVDRNDSQELSGRSPNPAPHTGADRSGTTSRIPV